MTQAVLLGDLVQINPESIGKSYKFDEILYLDTSSVTENKFSELQIFNLSDAPSRAKRIVRDGDIVYSTVRPNLKHFGYIKNPAPNTVASTGFAVIRASDAIDSRYLYYWLGADEKVNYLTALADAQTSTFPAFNPSALANLKIELPNLSVQKQIANILGSIDEKIELNRKMNETLEQMGQALFRHYFIVNPEAEKWEEARIGDLVDIRGGGTPSTKNSGFWNGNIAWTSPRDLTGKNDVYLLATNKRITEAGLAKVSSGLLPEHTLLLSSRAPIGHTAITGLPLAINQGYIAFLSSGYLSNYYMYYWLYHNMDRIKSAANGSTFMEISKTVFRNITTTKPDGNVQLEFESIVKSSFESMRSNQEQIQTLTTLRDTLLPKLISGKVKV